jgi:ABC-type oligopeptide transport system ATPase subunit
MFTKVTSNPLESKNIISTSKKEEKKIEKKEEILPHGAKKIEDYKHLQYSLIVNKDFNIADKIEDNWVCLKKNLMDLFGNNFNVEIKSLYSFDFADEQDKNYKIEKGRQRIDQLETDKKDYDVVTVGEFVSQMEKGLDTIIKDDGALSQGQKQLLCVARLMLVNPPLLILDEATSSIDTRTEMKIQDAFQAVMKGKTSFVVAHRLSTIVNSDLILVMNKGNVIEKGTHEELLEKHGFYYELYNAQFNH